MDSRINILSQLLSLPLVIRSVTQKQLNAIRITTNFVAMHFDIIPAKFWYYRMLISKSFPVIHPSPSMMCPAGLHLHINFCVFCFKLSLFAVNTRHGAHPTTWEIVL